MEVVLPKNKTVQKVMPVSGHVLINWIDVQEKEDKQSAELVPMQQNIPTRTGTVMASDYIPHQQYKLEDTAVSQKTKDRLENLLHRYNSIISKHTIDINTTPLIKMDIQTEGPPITS